MSAVGEAHQPTGDPGLEGVRPFRFACHRCGACCRSGEGYVWLADGEDVRIAHALDMDLATFRARFVRTVNDPRTGEPREALAEDPTRPAGNGRCALLSGDNACTVYGARPDHCASYPYWASVLEDEAGFERAAEVCPGIEEELGSDVLDPAFAELEALYAELDEVIARSRVVCLARGICCRFEEAGHELFAGRLELEHALARHPDPPEPEAPGRCPYHRNGACTAREGRPLGCRAYFCDPDMTQAFEEEHESFLTRLRDIESRHGIPRTYARFPELLSARTRGAKP